MQDYALADYTFFADIDEMHLNPRTLAGMYRDYVTVSRSARSLWGPMYGKVYDVVTIRTNRLMCMLSVVHAAIRECDFRGMKKHACRRAN